MSGIKCRDTLSATSFDVLGNCTKYATLAINALVLGSSTNAISLAGILLALTGSALYSPAVFLVPALTQHLCVRTDTQTRSRAYSRTDIQTRTDTAERYAYDCQWSCVFIIDSDCACIWACVYVCVCVFVCVLAHACVRVHLCVGVNVPGRIHPRQIGDAPQRKQDWPPRLTDDETSMSLVRRRVAASIVAPLPWRVLLQALKEHSLVVRPGSRREAGPCRGRD